MLHYICNISKCVFQTDVAWEAMKLHFHIEMNAAASAAPVDKCLLPDFPCKLELFTYCSQTLAFFCHLSSTFCMPHNSLNKWCKEMPGDPEDQILAFIVNGLESWTYIYLSKNLGNHVHFHFLSVR